MESDAWWRSAAYRPGSGWFGWMVSPVAVESGESDVNHREKVLEAIRTLKQCEEAAEKACSEYAKMEKAEAAARAGLERTLHAVYGERAQHGIVVDGEMYRLFNDQLIVDQVRFEVMS